MSSSPEIRRVLYLLKQRFGFPVGVYYRGQDSTDLRTGVVTASETVYRVRRAIVLPFNLFAKYFRHNGQSAFDYGGDLDVERQVFIIDRRDLTGVEINNTEQWYIVYRHKRYSVEKLDNFELNQAYVITAREVAGTETAEQIVLQVVDRLKLGDGFVSSDAVVDGLALSDQVVRS